MKQKGRLIFRAFRSTGGGYHHLEINIRQQQEAEYKSAYRGSDVKGWYTSDKQIDLTWQATVGETKWYGFDVEVKSRSADLFRAAAHLIERIEDKLGEGSTENPIDVINALSTMAVECKYDTRLNDWVELKDLKPAEYKKWVNVRTYLNYQYCLGSCLALTESDAQNLILVEAAQSISDGYHQEDIKAALKDWVSAGMPVELAYYSDAPEMTPALELANLGGENVA